MKYLYLLSLQLILLSAMLTAGCKRDRQTADIPDIESIYRNILYLDTLLQSDQIDSIGKVNDDLTARMQAYGNSRFASPHYQCGERLPSILHLHPNQP
jgi:hypothetical protein